MAPEIKVCGITRREDALLAEELGAWAVGFIFYPQSPRCIEPEAAAEITACLGEAIEKVGVFVDATEAEIVRAARLAGLTVAQLHGSEEPSIATGLRPHLRGVWKAVRIGDALPLDRLEAFRGWTILLDTLV